MNRLGTNPLPSVKIPCSELHSQLGPHPARCVCPALSVIARSPLRLWLRVGWASPQTAKAPSNSKSSAS